MMAAGKISYRQFMILLINTWANEPKKADF